MAEVDDPTFPSWDEAKILTATLKGIDPVEAQAIGEPDDDVLQSAKSMVETLGTERLAGFMLEVGGPEAFFDEVVQRPALASQVQSMLGYGYLYKHFMADAVGTEDGMHARATEMKSNLKSQVKAFSKLAPALIGRSKTATGGPQAFGSTSSYDRHPY